MWSTNTAHQIRRAHFNFYQIANTSPLDVIISLKSGYLGGNVRVTVLVWIVCLLKENTINSYKCTAREKSIYLLNVLTSQPGPPTWCAQNLVKITWNKGVEVGLQGPELVNVVISLLLRYPPRVIWVLGAAVLLLPLHWKGLKGGTLASATGRAPEGLWKPQETRFTLFYVAETNFQKTRSRNGHTDDHPTTYLLKNWGCY